MITTDQLFILRHGIRIDAVDPNWHLRPEHAGLDRSNPPLSQPGLRQAEDIARFCADLPVRAIWCSPFLRTIQTITPTARRLGLRLRLEGGMSEWRNPAWMTRDVVLASAQHLLDAGYPADLGYRELSPAAFPEPSLQIEVRQRVVLLLDRIRDDLPGSILVGHGATCKVATEALTGVELSLDRIPMGCLIRLRRDGPRWILDGFATDHLSVQERDVKNFEQV